MIVDRGTLLFFDASCLIAAAGSPTRISLSNPEPGKPVLSRAKAPISSCRKTAAMPGAGCSAQNATYISHCSLMDRGRYGGQPAMLPNPGGRACLRLSTRVGRRSLGDRLGILGKRGFVRSGARRLGGPGRIRTADLPDAN